MSCRRPRCQTQRASPGTRSGGGRWWRWSWLWTSTRAETGEADIESTSTAASKRMDAMEPYLVTNLVRPSTQPSILPRVILQTRPLRSRLALSQALSTRRHPQRRGSPFPGLSLALWGARRERQASPRGLDGALPRQQRLAVGPDFGRGERVGVERTQDATLDGRYLHFGC